MFSQKTTSLALTDSPSLHLQPFIVIVTVLPSAEYVGAFAGESG
jgi:hypothetical protein